MIFMSSPNHFFIPGIPSTLFAQTIRDIQSASSKLESYRQLIVNEAAVKSAVVFHDKIALEAHGILPVAPHKNIKVILEGWNDGIQILPHRNEKENITFWPTHNGIAGIFFTSDIGIVDLWLSNVKGAIKTEENQTLIPPENAAVFSVSDTKPRPEIELTSIHKAQELLTTLIPSLEDRCMNLWEALTEEHRKEIGTSYSSLLHLIPKEVSFENLNKKTDELRIILLAQLMEEKTNPAVGQGKIFRL